MFNGLWFDIFKREKKIHENYSFLSKIELFQNISLKQIKHMKVIFHIRNFKDNEIVFKKNQPGYGVYIILKGRIKIKSGSIKFADLKPKSFFGEMSLICEDKRSADAVSFGDSTLIFIQRNDFESYCRRNLGVGYSLLKNMSTVMAKRLTKTNEEYLKLNKKCPLSI